MLLNKNNPSVLLVGLTLSIVCVCSKLSEKVPVKPQDTQAQLHQTGWLDTLATSFHGKYIREHAWNLGECRKCHGNNYDGGTSGSSCNLTQCHPNTPESCTTCHGGRENLSGAPPKDIDNHVLSRFKGVGAHSAHVADLRWAKALGCAECHVKPGKLNDAGHLDSNLPAEIVWGEFSRKDNLTPVWMDSTCSNVYCHGASLKDGLLTRPVWTQSEPLTCNACHGIAPTSGAHEKHVDTQKLDCNTCHDGYQKNEVVNLNTHIDGRKDVRLSQTVGGTYADGACSNVTCHGSGNSPLWTEDAELACTSCHGGIDNNSGAPPKDLLGNTSKTMKGVGAHTAHVSAAKFGRPYDCTECHMKPTNIGDPGHVDSAPPAEILWGDLAKSDGRAPAWDGSNCRNVYCHGASLANGTLSNPDWTRAQALSCNACHGLPPNTGAHDEHTRDYQLDCQVCHEGYSKDTAVNQMFHINGSKDVRLSAAVGGTYANGVCSNVTCHGSGDTPAWSADVTLNCISCHGGTDNPTGAPPVDLLGNSSIGSRGVGAHTLHVESQPWARAFDCQECHSKPVKISDAGHVDITRPAEIIWGALSKKDGLAPSWNGSSCSNVYCHGASLKGGSSLSGQWTQAEAVNCASCHGLPPDVGAHEEHDTFDCQLCHDGYVKDTAANQAVHINGQRDVTMDASVGGSYANGVCSNVLCHGRGDTPPWTGDGELGCSSCHGGADNETGAPPDDLLGNASTTMKGVGAHTAHVIGGVFSDGMECSECHVKPDEIDAPGHIGIELLPAEIVWGLLAREDNAIPSWDGADKCENVYCHGESRYGNKDNNPSWIVVDGSQAACGSCHALPPARPHPADTQCSTCHAKVIDASNNIIDKEKHINGQTDLFMSK